MASGKEIRVGVLEGGGGAASTFSRVLRYDSE